ncbi:MULTISPECIES: MBL fold metallo-hydrolase [unclassified Streptomyces]|uniref:MBL fold metallo-hydrolase n=1 Tax=unclassified Streptomyces TaxID=2593676 RepID=UPI0038128B34
MTTEPQQSAARRAFLKRTLAAAAVPAIAASIGGALPGTAAAAAAAAEASDLPEFAPVPRSALGPALNADGYFVGRIKDNLYWVTDSHYQTMFLSTRDGVVLVDAPPSIGHNLLRAIDDVTRANGRPSKVTHQVYSHSHADHIAASAILGKDVVRIGHTETRRLLLTDADPNRPAPTVTFDDHYTLRVGGERLELAYHGPNHTYDNIFIHAPDQETLMVVDVFYPGWVPFTGLAVSQNVRGWVTAHDEAMRYPWKTLVGGHLGRLGVRSDADLQQQYVADLDASTRATYDSLDPTPFFDRYGPSGNAWAIFKTYLDAIAEQAALPVTAKYTGILAGADVYTTNNAFAMLESLRADYGVLGPSGIHP